MLKKTLSLHLEKRKKLFRKEWFLPLLQKRNVIRNLFNKVLISVQRKGYTKVRSREAGERVMQSLSSFIENRLKLKINGEKSKVCEVKESKFLGYTVLNNGMLDVSQQSIKRIKEKVKTITRRNRGVKSEHIITELNLKLRGRLNYFRYAKCHKPVQALDAWIRRKLRCYRINPHCSVLKQKYL